VDESNYEVQVTFWGKMALRNDFEIGKVLALKQVRVSDYNGKTLNASDEHSQIQFDPKHKRATELKQWYKTQSKSNFNKIT